MSARWLCQSRPPGGTRGAGRLPGRATEQRQRARPPRRPRRQQQCWCSLVRSSVPAAPAPGLLGLLAAAALIAPLIAVADGNSLLGLTALRNELLDGLFSGLVRRRL